MQRFRAGKSARVLRPTLQQSLTLVLLLQLYLFSDSGTEVSDTETVTSSVITETIATVLSGITGIIRAGANDGCSLEIINTAQVCLRPRPCRAAPPVLCRQPSVGYAWCAFQTAASSCTTATPALVLLLL